MDESQFDHILGQPLTNEDGSLNPACLNELEAAMKSMPLIPVRLVNDPEWNTPRIISRRDILGAFAMWAVRQSPYGCPDKIENVIKYLGACLQRTIEWDRNNFARLSLCEVERHLYNILMDGTVADFEAWNISKRAKEKREKQKTVFVSMASGKPDPDNDFIDLYALLRNVCITIRTERREDDAFDAKFEADFEAEHGEKPFQRKSSSPE